LLEILAVANDEPEYLKALRQNQEKHKAASSKPTTAATKMQSPAEREALRWAREVGGKDLRVSAGLASAKVAVLVQPITPFGKPQVSLEGLNDKAALEERVKAAQGAGENIVGAYEITTGRPLTVEVVEGKVNITPGQKREVLKAQSPEKMIRMATKQAEILAKTRKVDDRDRGGGGRR
jgi:hypothetical protein